MTRYLPLSTDLYLSVGWIDRLPTEKGVLECLIEIPIKDKCRALSNMISDRQLLDYTTLSLGQSFLPLTRRQRRQQAVLNSLTELDPTSFSLQFLAHALSHRQHTVFPRHNWPHTAHQKTPQEYGKCNVCVYTINTPHAHLSVVGSFLKRTSILKIVPPQTLNAVHVVCVQSIDGVNVDTTMLYSCREFPVHATRLVATP